MQRFIGMSTSCPYRMGYFPGLSTGPTRGSSQEVFKISRVGSGRVGSGQEVFEFSRGGVGSGVFHNITGRARNSDPTRPARCDPTREQPWHFRVSILAWRRIRTGVYRETDILFFSMLRLHARCGTKGGTDRRWSHVQGQVITFWQRSYCRVLGPYCGFIPWSRLGRGGGSSYS